MKALVKSNNMIRENLYYLNLHCCDLKGLKGKNYCFLNELL